MTVVVNKRFSIHYACKTSKGLEFSSRENDKPIEFTPGEGKLLSPLEDVVIGMKVGEIKTVKIESKDAYGVWSDDNLVTSKHEEMPEGIELKKGTPLMMHSENNEEVRVSIYEVSETEVVIDTNHPLADHDLTFDVELLEIKEV